MSETITYVGSLLRDFNVSYEVGQEVPVTIDWEPVSVTVTTIVATKDKYGQTVVDVYGENSAGFFHLDVFVNEQLKIVRK